MLELNGGSKLLVVWHVTIIFEETAENIMGRQMSEVCNRLIYRTSPQMITGLSPPSPSPPEEMESLPLTLYLISIDYI